MMSTACCKPLLAALLFTAVAAGLSYASPPVAPGPVATGTVTGGMAAEPLAGQAGLSAAHRDWLDLVAYIIEKEERRIFESLSTEWQRERFIEAFWERRDPEPVTPENEFRTEYMRRWEYVNDVFGRDTPVPGWRTDRGRVYLVNGPPFQVHPYPNTQQLWPLELWEYRASPRPGMPPFYQILFFKPRVFNEWRLYSPAVDGPEALVIASPADIDNINLQAVATKFPMVFTAAQQAAPGLGALGSEALIARTMAPPPPPRPASLYYTMDGEVETAFLSDTSVPLHLQAVGLPHPELDGYIDITLEVPAEETTFVEVGEQLVANYQVEIEIETDEAGTWRHDGGALVVRVPRQERDLVQELPIQFTKRLWLLPGSYRVRALVTETVTRRVGVAETSVVVPTRSRAVVGPPELFYVTESRAGGDGAARTAHVPWVDEKLRRGQPVSCLVRVLGPGGEAEPRGTFPDGLELEYRVSRVGTVVWTDTWRGEPTARAVDDGWAVIRELRLEELPAGIYELEVRAAVTGGDGPDGAAADRDSQLQVGSVGRRRIELVDEFLPVARLLPAVPEAWDLAAGHHALGRQALRLDDFATARGHFERAARLAPQNPVYKVDAAKTLVLSGELSVAAFLLAEAVNRDPGNDEAFATLGLLRLQQGEFPGAIEAYRRALDLAPGTPAIYNGLAEAYLSVGDVDRALEMLDHSLAINGEQRQVRELRDRLARDGVPELPARR